MTAPGDADWVQQYWTDAIGANARASAHLRLAARVPPRRYGSGALSSSSSLARPAILKLGWRPDYRGWAVRPITPADDGLQFTMITAR
jgi:hypothetical protein